MNHQLLLTVKVIGVVTASIIAPVAHASVTFSDGNFVNWSHESFISGSQSTVTATTLGSGGNPDAYLQLDFRFNGIAGIQSFSWFNGAVYDPSSQGAISTLDIAQDRKTFSATSGTGFSNAIQPVWAVRQNGKRYIAFTTVSNLGTWQSFAFSDVTAQHFAEVLGVNSSNPNWLNPSSKPNFSASGSTIEFGFHVGGVGTNAFMVTGLDNYSVTINTVPEPATSAMIALGAFMFRLRLRRNKSS